MMINKRLIRTVAESKPYIAANVLLQWCSLAANIVLMAAISRLLAGLYLHTADLRSFAFRRPQPRRRWPCALPARWGQAG